MNIFLLFAVIISGDGYEKMQTASDMQFKSMAECQTELKKTMFSESKDLEYVKNWVLSVSEKLLTEKGIRLKQAILDVEICQ